MDEVLLVGRLEGLGIAPKPQMSPHDHLQFFVIDLADILVLPGANNAVFFSLDPGVELDADAAGQLEEIIQARGYRDRIKFIEYSNASEDGLQILGQVPNLAAYSRTELAQLKKTAALKSFLTALLVKRVSLSALNPYIFQGPVVGSRFFGRDYELSRLRLQTGKSWVITGVRRSGKTSLMMELQRQLRPTSGELAVFVNFETCQKPGDVPYLLLRRLAEELKTGPPSLSQWSDNLLRLSTSRQWHQTHHLSHLVATLWSLISTNEGAGGIRFLFDEYDQVIKLEQTLERIFTKAWRDLVMRARAFARGHSSAAFVQFIFAGSRTLYQEILTTGSPFFNIGAEQLLLPNFQLDTLTALITRPMRELGVKVTDAPRMAQVLLDQTGGHPATTQHLMSLVVCNPRLEEVRSVGYEDVQRAAAKQEFLGLLHDTLTMNVSALGRFILAQMVVVNRDRVNVGFVQGIGRKHSIQFEESPLIVELQDLANSGYLRPLDFAGGQSTYELAVPVVKRVFCADDVPKLISEMLAKKLCTAVAKA